MKERTLLMIPGPIEFDLSVLAEMGAQTTSHVAASWGSKRNWPDQAEQSDEWPPSQ